MEFLQITSPEDYRVQEIYKSYSTTFPEDERGIGFLSPSFLVIRM
jgi:hypothetical protein